ncbi:MAG: acyl-ACP desaturase, partial [Acidimicrobiales bacterium]
DENLHHLFYRDLVSAAIEIDPSTMVLAIADQVPGFAMPGTGVPDFAAHARAIAAVGIFDLGILLEQVLLPVVRNHWHLHELEGLSPEAEAAREKVIGYLDRMARVVERMASRRDKTAAAV